MRNLPQKDLIGYGEMARLFWLVMVMLVDCVNSFSFSLTNLVIISVFVNKSFLTYVDVFYDKFNSRIKPTFFQSFVMKPLNTPFHCSRKVLGTNLNLWNVVLHEMVGKLLYPFNDIKNCLG